jgi:hypothetical protein
MTSYEVIAAENSLAKAAQVLGVVKDGADNEESIAGHVDLLEQTTIDGLIAGGWAFDHSADHRSAFVGIATDGKIAGIARMTEPRVDLADDFRLAYLRTTPPGFIASAKARCAAELRAIAFTLDGRHRQLDGPSKIDGC